MKYVLLIIAVLALGIMACESQGKGKASKAQTEGARVVAAYQSRLTSAVPYPLAEMRDSTERRNIRERLLRFNDPSKLGYVYLLTDFGEIVSYFTVQGKPSSISSQLTPSQQAVCQDVPKREDPCGVVVESPMDDGTWGPSEAGIFFFTTEGVLLEWNGPYLYSDFPLDIDPGTLKIRYDAENAQPSNEAAPVPSTEK